MDNPYVILALATLPAAYILGYLLNQDKNYANNTIVYQLFFVGFVLSIPIVYAELFLLKNILQENAFTNSFLVASLIEEGSKFIVLLIVVYGNKFNLYKTILCSLGVSLGFATVENIVYIFPELISSGGDAATSIGFLRAFSAVPLHACCAYFMGFYMWDGLFSENKPEKTTISGNISAFLIPFFIHGFYNYFIMSETIPGWFSLIYITLISYFLYEINETVLAFHKSKLEKVKFSWKAGLIAKPGDGEVHDFTSYRDQYVDIYVILLIISFIVITVFFQTGLFVLFKVLLNSIINFFDYIRIELIQLLGGTS